MPELPPGCQQLLYSMNKHFLDGVVPLSEKESKAKLKELFESRREDRWSFLQCNFYEKFGKTTFLRFCNILSQCLAGRSMPWAEHLGDGCKIREYPLYDGSGTYYQRLWRAMWFYFCEVCENPKLDRSDLHAEFPKVIWYNVQDTNSLTPILLWVDNHLEPERRAIEEQGWISDEDSEKKIIELFDGSLKENFESEKIHFRNYGDNDVGIKIDFRDFLRRILDENKKNIWEVGNKERRPDGTSDQLLYQSLKPLLWESDAMDAISQEKLDRFVSNEVKEGVRAIELKAFMLYCVELLFPPFVNDFENDLQYFSLLTAYNNAIADVQLKYRNTSGVHGPIRDSNAKEITPAYVWEATTIETLRNANNDLEKARVKVDFEIIPKGVFVRRAISILQGFVKRREEIVAQTIASDSPKSSEILSTTPFLTEAQKQQLDNEQAAIEFVNAPEFITGEGTKIKLFPLGNAKEVMNTALSSAEQHKPFNFVSEETGQRFVGYYEKSTPPQVPSAMPAALTPVVSTAFPQNTVAASISDKLEVKRQETVSQKAKEKNRRLLIKRHKNIVKRDKCSKAQAYRIMAKDDGASDEMAIEKMAAAIKERCRYEKISQKKRAKLHHSTFQSAFHRV